MLQEFLVEMLESAIRRFDEISSWPDNDRQAAQREIDYLNGIVRDVKDLKKTFPQNLQDRIDAALKPYDK